MGSSTDPPSLSPRMAPITVAVLGSCSSRRNATLDDPPRSSSSAKPFARSEITTIPMAG